MIERKEYVRRIDWLNLFWKLKAKASFQPCLDVILVHSHSIIPDKLSFD